MNEITIRNNFNNAAINIFFQIQLSKKAIYFDRILRQKKWKIIIFVCIKIDLFATRFLL